MSEARLVVFTIAARNFIAYAVALHGSLMRHHPEARFVLALCDIDDGFDHATLPFEVLPLPALRDTRVWGMAARYNVTEFCTAIKPLVFQVLMDQNPGAAIVYMDPDILIVSRMTELERTLDAGAHAVMTPHIVQPSSQPWHAADQAMLQFGIYNLGFLALAESHETRAMLGWWADRLEQDCRIDLQAGLFVDQKWADLFPALMSRVSVLRHPGYNVAYWNVLERPVYPTPQGWFVNQAPLRFIHFSGHDLLTPEIFSRHAKYLTRWNTGASFILQAQFRDAVLDAGFTHYAAHRYGFRFTGDAGANPHSPVEMADQIAAGHAAVGQPLATWDSLFSTTITSWDDWQAQRPDLEAAFAAHREAERSLTPMDGAPFMLPARCGMCRTDALLGVSYVYAVHHRDDGAQIPNWREHLECRCGFVNRVRGAMQVLESLVAPPPGAAIYLTEEVTRLHAWVKHRWPGTVGSEYLGADHTGGQRYDGVRHEDLCRLSFDSDRFDVVVSLDVLEHVRQLYAALGECWRVLKPGGTLLFAAPSQFDERPVIDLALPGPDGAIEHLRPPEYHGNPVDPARGSLCFRYLGLEVLDRMRSMGFEDVRCVLYWSSELGLLGPNQAVFLARKPMRKRAAPRRVKPPVVTPAAPAPHELPDAWAYGQHVTTIPTLQPHLLDPDVAVCVEHLRLLSEVSLVDTYRMMILLRLLRSTASVEGEVWELGVYRGGTAVLIRNELARTGYTTFRLFDTFAGMPATDAERDLHQAGDFAGTSLAEVQEIVGRDPFLDWRPGVVPETFAGLESAVLRFVHVDLDIYAPILATLEFAWPRMNPGAIVVFDDYGFVTCPGARAAVDEFCAARGLPLVPVPSGQAFLIKPA